MRSTRPSPGRYRDGCEGQGGGELAVRPVGDQHEHRQGRRTGDIRPPDIHQASQSNSAKSTEHSLSDLKVIGTNADRVDSYFLLFTIHI